MYALVTLMKRGIRDSIHEGQASLLSRPFASSQVQALTERLISRLQVHSGSEAPASWRICYSVVSATGMLSHEELVAMRSTLVQVLTILCPLVPAHQIRLILPVFFLTDKTCMWADRTSSFVLDIPGSRFSRYCKLEKIDLAKRHRSDPFCQVS